MTEAEWLACEQPMAMFNHLERVGWVSPRDNWLGKAASWLTEPFRRKGMWSRAVLQRRLYLLACGVNRVYYAEMGYGGSMSRSVELEERFADRELTLEELQREDPQRQWWWPNPWHLVSNVFRRPLLVAGLSSHGAVYCDLTRCVFGNPFRRVALDRQWLTSTVVALAAGIYTERAFDRMPILADALQDAGCADEQVLTHCREGRHHCRGCWVVDLLLGK